MPRFRGVVEGNRGPSSRLGTANSGLQVLAQSWQGSISVDFIAVEGTDHVRVVRHGVGRDRHTEVIYNGPVNPEQFPEAAQAT